MVDLSKFTSNETILSRVVVISYNKVCNQTLSFNYYWIMAFVIGPLQENFKTTYIENKKIIKNKTLKKNQLVYYFSIKNF